MINKLRLLTLLFCFVSVCSYGAETKENVTIKDVIVNMEKGVHFRINEAMDYNETCDSTNWFKVENNSQYEKEALTMLLAYEAQNKPVTIRLSGCSGGYPKLYYIY